MKKATFRAVQRVLGQVYTCVGDYVHLDNLSDISTVYRTVVKREAMPTPTGI